MSRFTNPARYHVFHSQSSGWCVEHDGNLIAEGLSSKAEANGYVVAQVSWQQSFEDERRIAAMGA